MRPEIERETREMYELHRAGMTIAELEAKYYVSGRAISERFRVLALPRVKWARPYKISETQAREMHELRLKGVSYAHIARKYGVAKETVINALARYGFSSTNQNESYEEISNVNNGMTLNEYQMAAQRTSAGENKLDNGCLGLAGESGECCDILKKHRFQGHELDVNHLIEELGDVMWYVAEAAAGLGVTLEDVAKRNVEKLELRYPSGFDAQRSIHRGA